MTLGWLSREAYTSIQNEAKKALPNETGGILLGYWAKDENDVVIVKAIGPGPKAIHGQYFFIPDYQYHCREAAREYHESKRTLVYLGDWHSHPDYQPILSKTDRKTLGKISKSRQARIQKPLMLILTNDDEWEVFVWQWRLKQKDCCLKAQHEVAPLKITFY